MNALKPALTISALEFRSIISGKNGQKRDKWIKFKFHIFRIICAHKIFIITALKTDNIVDKSKCTLVGNTNKIWNIQLNKI